MTQSNLGIQILKELFNMEIRYKGGHRASLALLVDTISGKKTSVQTSLTRLRRKGFVQNYKDGWQISESGREFIHSENLHTFKSPFNEKSKKDLLLMFDIPEDARHYRDWLREQLRKFGYIMIQQSVWAGPSPLPLEFKKYLKKLGLQKSIRTFKLKNGIVLK